MLQKQQCGGVDRYPMSMTVMAAEHISRCGH
jgi:hypothetical protein